MTRARRLVVAFAAIEGDHNGKPNDRPSFHAGFARTLTWRSRRGASAWRVSLFGAGSLVEGGELYEMPRFLRIVGCINEWKPYTAPANSTRTIPNTAATAGTVS